MKPTINYRQTACRLLAGLFFFLLLVPMAAGQEVSPTPSNWKDQISAVEKIANVGGGDGTVGNPILIATAKELAYFAQQVNEGKDIDLASGGPIKPNGNGGSQGGFINYYFALSADINLEKHYWTPIGTNDNPFKGYFDGKGHCVSGLKVNVIENNAQDVYAGLFGNAAFSTLQNLGVRLAKEGVQATAENGFAYAGGIAGKAKIINCCYVEGSGSVKAVSSKGEVHINSGSYAGGIVGYLFDYPFLTHCYATVAVKADAKSKSYAGGIAGMASGNTPSDSYKLSYTYATGAVEATRASQNNYAGGICGYAQSLTIGNNLALNDFIKGNEKYSNRIVGSTEKGTTLRTNYASPEILVNDKTVSDETDGDANGDPNVNLDIFDKVFSGGAGWDTSDKTHLPKLKIQTGDGPDYKDWPTGEDFTPQSPPDATQYLQADKIANAGGGNGLSWKNAIQIANRAELAYLAKQVNAKGNLTVAEGVDGGSIENKGEHEGFKGIYFALANDIDLEKHYWKPIGTEGNPFQGNFDGAGHKVEGLVVNVDVVSNSAYAGLFGCLYDGATIRNLGIRLGEAGVKATVSTTGSRTNPVAYAGGLAGKLSSGTIISNCYVEGEACVKATSPYVTYAGGLVGYTLDNVTITHCYTTVNVSTDGLQKGQCGAGGIVGSSSGKISYTYATGTVDAKGVTYAGGICGKIGTNGTITNSLALNTAINGQFTGRIVGIADKLTSNYATPLMQLSGQTSSYNQVNNENGANTWPGSFEADLKKEPAGDANGWATSWTFTSGYLPQLMKKTADGYEAWSSEQPELKTNLYFPSRPKLHIVSPTGGTLKVTDKDGNELPNGSDILPGTLLTLAYTEDANYHFSGYLSGSNEGSLSSYSGNSITMTDADLYLSATFTYQKPEPEEPPYIPPVPPYVPPVPIYYSVYLPQVEGATTDPGPGEHEVESWSTFRFYLTIDSAYSDSQPVVTTDRGETLVPRSSDGAYLVKYVRTDVEVFIDGLIQNPPPVANEAIGTDALAPQIWSEGTMLCIRMPEALTSAPVRIFTVDGRLYDSFDSTPGLNRRQLPTGIYIVRVGETVRKVVVPKT